MPRSARVRSQTNIYHVMLRGINKQQIFFDEEDNRYFIKLLDRFKQPCGYRLYAYCLMGNHVHLLIQEGEEASVGDVFRHIGSAFVYWYNIKYERNGHLFQDRYKSEPVNNDAHLLTVFRYILMNPVKAGLCRKPEDYPYSSAAEYLQNTKGITDTALISGKLKENGITDFLNLENDDRCLDLDETPRKRCTDEAAVKMILNELGSLSPAAGKAKDRTSLNKSICRLIRSGISIRQLSRLTGLSKKIIEDALKQ